MMAPFCLDGETLGEKHKSYNKKLNDFILKNLNEKPTPLSYDDCDIENLFKIDIACRQKDIDYILEVLKCRDMLYVSRAIKQSKWLITGPQYANIINPDFIHNELLPYMSTKAYNKLILHIRLNLRDEVRVDKFYIYFENIDLQRAFKWLPYASPMLLGRVIKQHCKAIPLSVMKRFPKRSDYLLEYCKDLLNVNYYCDMEISQVILRTDPKNYVKFLKLIQEYQIPKLSANKTKKIMKTCPDEIINNITKFVKKVHIETFSKNISSRDIKDFLLKNSQNPYLRPLYKHDKLKFFIKRLPEKDKIDLVKSVFLDKKEIQYTEENDLYNNTMIRCLSNMNNEYLWYEFMPFDIAFEGLIKLIETESSPVKKCNMLCLLLSCAHGCEKHIQEVLKYYHKNHIHEAFKYKARFVQHILSKEDTYYFEESTWNLLNNLFYSMGIYTQSFNNKVDEFVDCIILYNSVNFNDVPEIITSKFNFKTFKNIQKILSEEEKSNLFEFLINFNIKNLEQYNIADENDLEAIMSYLKNLLDLGNDYEENIIHYPLAFHKINDIISFLVSQSRFEDLKKIYNIGIYFKRQIMFANSIFMNETENDCINALRYGPHLLIDQVRNICEKPKLPKKQFFHKLRVYWHDTLAVNFKDTYFKMLSENCDHTADMVGQVVTLLSHNETEQLLHKYLVTDYKKQNNKPMLWKGIANNLHLARPQPSLELLLSYTNNINFSHISAAIHFLLHDMNYLETRQIISRFSDMIIPLQKVALRFACMKFNHDEIIKLFHKTWLSTRNRCIRVLIFKLTFSLLCSPRNDKVAKDVWNLMDSFIGNLGRNEHKSIYVTLCNLKKCPLIIRQDYYKKVSTFLKTLPNDSYYKTFEDSLCIQDSSMNWIIDTDCVLKKNDVDIKKLTTKRCYVYWLPEYLLDIKDEETQMKRYHAVFVPFLDYVICTWHKTSQESPAKGNLLSIMEKLYNFIGIYLLNKELVVPITMFSDIHARLENALPHEENYLFLKSIKLAVCYLKVLDLCIKSNTNKDRISEKACESFGKICVEQLNDDIEKYSPSIYLVFSQGLDHLISKLEFGVSEKLFILKGIISYNPSTECYFVVVELLPRYVYNGDEYNLRRNLINKMKSRSLDAITMYLRNYFLRV